MRHREKDQMRECGRLCKAKGEGGLELGGTGRTNVVVTAASFSV